MKRITFVASLVAIAASIALFAQKAEANSYPVCLEQSDGAGRLCQFETLAQCRSAAAGLSANCSPEGRDVPALARFRSREIDSRAMASDPGDTLPAAHLADDSRHRP